MFTLHGSTCMCVCREIQAHVAEPFWYIYAEYCAPDGTSCKFDWNRGRLFDYFFSTILLELCSENTTATVTKVCSILLLSKGRVQRLMHWAADLRAQACGITQ